MTSAPAVDERLHREALTALLTIPLEGHVYDYGTVPGDPNNPDDAERALPLPDIYVLLTVERRFAAPMKSGRTGVSAWRITARGVGTAANEVRWALLQVAEAIEEKRLVIGGQTSTPVAHDKSTVIAPDDGRFSGLTSYTYAL
jgi:hypothetical protein